MSDARLTSLNQLLYVFNAKKTDVIAAKEIMRKVFKNNAPKIYTARPDFFSFPYNGSNLTVDTFQNFVDNVAISHPIFNFITVN